MTVKVRNLGRVKAKLKTLSEKTTKTVKQEIAIATLRYELELKEEISTGTRTGIMYKRGRKTHQASAPGEPPKSDTGTLVNSIHHVFTDKGLTGEVKSNLPYALSLEVGTSKVPARPVWFPTAERLKPKFTKDLGISLNVAINKIALK